MCDWCVTFLEDSGLDPNLLWPLFSYANAIVVSGGYSEEDTTACNVFARNVDFGIAHRLDLLNDVDAHIFEGKSSQSLRCKIRSQRAARTPGPDAAAVKLH